MSFSSALGRNVLQSALKKPNIMSQFTRSNSGVTPPRVRVSFAEKMVHAGLLIVGITAVPIWIIAHLEEYRTGGNKAE